jgi:hypothetical protein
VTEEPAINEDDGTRSFTLIVAPYEESRPASSKPQKTSHKAGQTVTHNQGRHPAAADLEKTLDATEPISLRREFRRTTG